MKFLSISTENSRTSCLFSGLSPAGRLPVSLLAILHLLPMLFTALSCASGAEFVVPDDYPLISFAIEMAEPGDTVVVKAGIYNERITMKAGITLVSSSEDGGDDVVDGPGRQKVLKRTLRTIIDGGGIKESGYLISFPSETTEEMQVDGFTFRNMPEYNSNLQLFLMEIRGCSPVVINNIFTGNRSGGGILATGLGVGMGPELQTRAQPLITKNVIYGNMGTGISNGSNSAALITRNEIFENRFPDSLHKQLFAPAIGVREKARPLIEHNLCYRNETGIGAINLDGNRQELVIRGNEIYENLMAGIGIRGIGGDHLDNRVLIERNMIFSNMEAGIRCTKIEEAYIKSNKIHDNRKSGISLWNVTKGMIEDNNIFENYTSGIRLLDVQTARLKGNRIYRNVTAGIDFIGWKK